MEEHPDGDRVGQPTGERAEADGDQRAEELVGHDRLASLMHEDAADRERAPAGVDHALHGHQREHREEGAGALAGLRQDVAAIEKRMRS